jgi:hypothetical protein
MGWNLAAIRATGISIPYPVHLFILPQTKTSCYRAIMPAEDVAKALKTEAERAAKKGSKR